MDGLYLTTNGRHYAFRDGEARIAGICLVQAVRSFLHFSQLSAWLNKSNGSRPSPSQLLYRVTMPGQAFASKFAGSKPVEHHFPVAHVGRLRTHVIKVSSCCGSLPSRPTFLFVYGLFLFQRFFFLSLLNDDDRSRSARSRAPM